jgi:hypothetical protein
MWHTTWRMESLFVKYIYCCSKINPKDQKKRLSTWMSLYVLSFIYKFWFWFWFSFGNVRRHSNSWLHVQQEGRIMLGCYPKLLKRSVLNCVVEGSKTVTLVVGKVQIHVNWGQREQFPKGNHHKILYPYLKKPLQLYIYYAQIHILYMGDDMDD